MFHRSRSRLADLQMQTKTKPNKTRSRAQKLMEMQEENRTEIAPDKNKQNAADRQKGQDTRHERTRESNSEDTQRKYSYFPCPKKYFNRFKKFIDLLNLINLIIN